MITRYMACGSCKLYGYMSGYKVFAGIETKMSINRDTLRKKQQELTNGSITSFELAKIYIIGEQ